MFYFCDNLEEYYGNGDKVNNTTFSVTKMTSNSHQLDSSSSTKIVLIHFMCYVCNNLTKYYRNNNNVNSTTLSVAKRTSNSHHLVSSSSTKDCTCKVLNVYYFCDDLDWSVWTRLSCLVTASRWFGSLKVQGPTAFKNPHLIPSLVWSPVHICARSQSGCYN
jgi:hypothetical protein